MATQLPSDPELIAKMASDEELSTLAHRLFLRSCDYRYSYNFSWLGRPIIQYPQDMMAMQEIIWNVQPDLIVETGIAHGGGLVFYASLLEMIGGDGLVLGIDIEIRKHNRRAIESHRMARRIRMLEGSSVDESVMARVRQYCESKQRIMVILDSNHTHEHVRRELELYAPIVTVGSYLVIFDTVVERMPASAFMDRPWGPGNNPHTAVQEFMRGTDRFVVDHELEGKLLLTVAPGGYLKCVKA